MTSIIARLERIRKITLLYDKLQGLKMIPVAIYLFGIALYRSELWHWFTIWDPLSTLGLLILCIAGYVAIDKYYKRNFGRVTSSSPEQITEWMLPGLFGVLLIASGYIEFYAVLPMSLSCLVISILLFYFYQEEPSLRFHYLVWSAIVFLMGILPIFGFYSPSQVYLMGPDAQISLIVLGVILLTAGLIDHSKLVQTISANTEAY